MKTKKQIIQRKISKEEDLKKGKYHTLTERRIIGSWINVLKWVLK